MRGSIKPLTATAQMCTDRDNASGGVETQYTTIVNGHENRPAWSVLDGFPSSNLTRCRPRLLEDAGPWHDAASVPPTCVVTRERSAVTVRI